MTKPVPSWRESGDLVGKRSQLHCSDRQRRGLGRRPVVVSVQGSARRYLLIAGGLLLRTAASLDLAAGEPLSGFDDGRVAVIRIAGQRPGVQNKLATRCPGIGCDDGSFHTEFVRCAGLASADALHLRSVEGIQLPAALALLLRADLIGT